MPDFVTGVDYVAIPTQDYETSAAFYEKTLGLPLRKRWGRAPGGEYQAGNLTLAIMQMDGFGQEFRRNTAPLALRVPDVEKARAELESAGVEFAGETIDSGECLQAIFHDPDGNTLILHHRYAPGG